ncbi:hypothetical protein HDIA_0766 [Hartmannibacter diazotrophicus]|uniref:Uncharacterized protein n=1 Tax=Hartmannibacter diazotrophicus TaxID=1482074 RepID=A0A2C9D1Q7_9HYPH|nr:hypothetical protein [Hartmannibacter diazotrophicus]SON54307.1 hypothetical protein HDIA_0766 [Hartmannibacter diazotrophicus]
MRLVITHFHRNFPIVFLSRMIEWEHSVSLFLFGLMIYIRPEIISESETCPNFMRIWGNPIGWAVLCMSVGGLRFMVLIVNGLFRRSPHLRAVCSLVSGFVLLQIILGFVSSGYISTAFAIYPTHFFFECVIFVMTIRYAKIVDLQARNVRQATQS